MDTFTKDKRTECMSRIRSKDTSPEIAVRKFLTSNGLRYRLHSAKLAGKPDIVLSRFRTVIFINGCFWHQHKGCKRQSVPKSNKRYWNKKLENNIIKQKESISSLKKQGWKVIVIWECEAKNEANLTKLVKRMGK